MADDTVRQDGDGQESYWSLMLDAGKKGDTEAGMDALRECGNAVDQSNMPEPLRGYLRDVLRDITEGMKADRALHIEIERGAGRPANPSPDWEERLVAVAALMLQRGYTATRIEEAMDDARQSIEQKSLDEREARRIREKYTAMEALSERVLIQLCHDLGVGGEMSKYPPLT
mgnify:CR=1 FL=1